MSDAAACDKIRKMKTVIIIPARYASSRLPGKPLAMIRGQTMLQRVVAIANQAANGMPDVTVNVATDHDAILQHCQTLNVNAIYTDPDLPSGTDRVAAAVAQLPHAPDFILNLQGDAPFTPPAFLRAMITSFEQVPCDVITPVTQLSWEQLDKLRENKKSTPFSGTTALFDEKTGHAFWFSKSILPLIRKEEQLRHTQPLSPVFRHIGLYGYSLAMLQKYVTLPESKFEKLEGLEQLRLLENHYTIRCIPVDYQHRASMSGIDSPEDIARAEHLIDQYGESLQ